MRLGECYRALWSTHTFNPGRNAHLRTGLLLGMVLPASALLLAGAYSLSGGERPLVDLRILPWLPLMIAHLVLFGLSFGALGTIMRNRELLHERNLGQMSELAMRDPLTGLYNRRFVEEELKNLLHRASRTGGPVSVVFFDLDHFKEVNQREGHRGGDLMLKMVAEALQSVLRQGEILGRYGGDEFLLVVAADLSYASRLVERAVKAVEAWTRLSLSAGAAMFSEDGTTAEELIAAADARLTIVQERHHAEQRSAAAMTAR